MLPSSRRVPTAYEIYCEIMPYSSTKHATQWIPHSLPRGVLHGPFNMEHRSMAARKDVHFDMIRRLRVADYVTLSNALCGSFSIFFSLQQHFLIAYGLVYLGYELDRLDGKVARWRNECSQLGEQLDSLSDLVTFGMSPIVMLYSMGFNTLMDQIALVFYILCGISRLARYNVVAHLSPKDNTGRALYFEGLPIPYSALIVSTSATMFLRMDWTSKEFESSAIFAGSSWAFHLPMIPLIMVGAMMTSQRVRIKVNLNTVIPVIIIPVIIYNLFIS